MMERRGFLGQLLAGVGLGFAVREAPTVQYYDCNIGPEAEFTVTQNDGWMYYIDASTGTHYRVRKI